MRLFGSDRIVKYMERMGLEEGQELEAGLLNRSIEQAQKRVEQHNFQIRKRTLEYDDVMNKQREVIYGFRNEVIRAEDVRDRLMDIMEEVVIEKVTTMTTADQPSTWNVQALNDWVTLNFPLPITEEDLSKAATSGSEMPVQGSAFDGLSVAQFAVCRFIIKQVRDAYDLKVTFENPDHLKTIERFTILSAIDELWQEHLYSMDTLRSSIGLRAYGQRDPLVEYKAEAYTIFQELMTNIKSRICHNIFRSASSQMAFENFFANLPKRAEHQSVSTFGGPSPSNAPAQQQGPSTGSDMVTEATEALSKTKPVRATGPKVGRNDPCPCGSGKKYKQCCGR
jgi:preprotein translocase subunit SecA